MGRITSEKLLSSRAWSPCAARTAIVAVLRGGGGGYAAELIARVSLLTSDHDFSLDVGQIRTALVELERYAMIERIDGPRGPRGRPRIYYQLTSRGERLYSDYRAVFRALFP